MHPDYAQPRTGASWWEYGLIPTVVGPFYWGGKGIYEGITSDAQATTEPASGGADHHERRHGGGGGGGRGKRHDGMDWTTVVYVGIGVTAALGLAYIVVSRTKKAA